MRIKTDIVYRQTGVFNMTDQEKENTNYSKERIMRIVMDQWKLFAHYKVRLECHKNVALTRMFNLLSSKYKLTKYDALHRVSKYDVFVKSKTKRQWTKIGVEGRYERLALALFT